jgi:hypothetical protein
MFDDHRVDVVGSVLCISPEEYLLIGIHVGLEVTEVVEVIYEGRVIVTRDDVVWTCVGDSIIDAISTDGIVRDDTYI